MCKNKTKNYFLAFLRFCIVVYLLANLSLYLLQEHLLFKPVKLPQSHLFLLKDTTEIAIPVNGATLNALHFTRNDPAGIIIFLHGNQGNLSNWFTDTSFYEEVNYDVLMIDYRGFGKSTGYIQSEKQLLEDNLAAWKFIADRYKNKKKIVYGRSIGTALGAALSKDIKPNLTILVSPYYSMLELKKENYPWVPNFILRYPLDTSVYLKGLENPLLIIHGDKDSVISHRHSELLYRDFPSSKFVLIRGAGHNDISQYPEYLKAIIYNLDSIENEK